MNAYIANPLSRKAIRDFAQRLRRRMGVADRCYLDIVYVVEVLFREILDPELNFIVAPTEEMGNVHGLTNPATKTIKIREDVYDRACEGHGRDRLTIAHELGHYLMHDDVTVGLARIGDEASVATYCDPEWQANAFAGELLMPHELIRNMSIDEIVAQCKVSYSAAEIQRRK